MRGEGRAARPVGAGVAVSFLAAATAWTALTSWSPFLVEPGTLLRPLALVAIVVASTGAALRSGGVPRVLVTPLQAVVGALVVCLVVTGSLLLVGPGGSELGTALRTGVETARTYAAPVGPSVPPLWPLLLASGAVFIVLVDALAATYGRAAAAGLALLAVYAVPSGLDQGVTGGAVGFAVTAVGFAVLLQLDHRLDARRWGHEVDSTPRPRSAQERGRELGVGLGRSGATRITVIATAAALAVPLLLPGVGLQLFDGGAGSGDGEIRIRKPVADMKRDLERGADRPLIRVFTDDPDPSYLRISVLNRYTGEQWSSGDRDVAREDRAQGALPPPVGLDPTVPLTSFDYRLQVSPQFDSTWLPTSYPATEVRADGDWRFDPSTLDILAADDDLTTSGLQYTFTAARPDLGRDGRFFRDAAPSATATEVRDLPAVPAIVQRLARSVTEGADNDYERALLLQRWFRQDGGFRYDLARSPDGTGNDTLASFLARSGRVGYCEQFASAMAVMARSLGIPARLAVGFLRPEQVSQGVWEYSSHDLHAWPELYFSGAGWVRFEPTPAGRAATTPDYTRGRIGDAGGDPSAGPSDQQSSAGPDQGPSAGTSQAPGTQDPDIGRENGAGADDGTSPLVVALWAGAAVLLLAVAALVGPRSLRRRQRRARLAGGPDEHWRELAATARDLGLPWDDDRSPREMADVVLGRLADPAAAAVERPATGPDVAPEAAAALERLLLSVERARYARPADETGRVGGGTALAQASSTTADLSLVIAALEAGAPRRSSRSWLPSSLRTPQD